MTIEYYKFDFECKWSEFDTRNGLDRPWMCHMPNIVGSVAVFIGLSTIIYTTYEFVNFIRENSKVSIPSSQENTLLSHIEE